MSSGIWTACAGESEVRPLRLDPWRVVEAGHQVSTRRLVDSDAEHAVLEALIESVKPPPLVGELHYLLATPFRYPPLPHGSRFGEATGRGIWYGAESERTALAETAYYRLLFLEGTRANLGVVATALTGFRVSADAARGIDLTKPPFDRFAGVIASRDSYTETQALGRDLRNAAVEVIRYSSARDVSGGINVAVLSPQAFGHSRPRDFRSWHCTASRERVEMLDRDWFERRSFLFPRSDFLVDSRLPHASA